MNDKTSTIETPPAVSHARRAAMFRQLLTEIREEMVKSHGVDHPWIPGATCKPLLDKIDKALGLEPAVQ